MPPNRFLFAVRVALAAVMVATFVVHAVYGPDWELLVSKHYWSRGFFYGGYAHELLSTPRGYRAVQMEGFANIQNLVPITTATAYGTGQPRVEGFPGTERLLVPFAVGGILRVTGGDLLTAFWILNVAVWLIAIILAYRIAQRFYADPYAPLLAAMLVAAYPVYTLTFNGVKLQQLGTTYLLIGIYLYERTFRHRSFPLQVAALATLLFIGMFASGGWALLAVYLLLRQMWIPGRQRWLNLAAIVVAAAVARYGFTQLAQFYELPSVEQYTNINYPRLANETWQWLNVWWAGGDVSQLKFVNLAGMSFFDVFLPTIARAFVAGHLWTLVLAVIAAVFVPPARMFVIMAVPMFLLGHLASALTGWSAWHYGYLSSPAAVLCFLAVGGGLGALASAPSPARRTAAMLLLAAMLWGFLDQKRHAGLFWGGDPRAYASRVIIHYEGAERVVRY